MSGTDVLPDAVTEDIGPLPVWAWGALLGGITVLWMYFSRRSGQVDTPPVSPDTTGLVDLGNAGEAPSGTSAGGSSAAPAPDPASGTSRFGDNFAWETAGVAFLVTSGVSPLSAQQALEAYLNGKQLTSSQGTIVGKVVAQLGLPPEGSPAPNVKAAAHTYSGLTVSRTYGKPPKSVTGLSRVWSSKYHAYGYAVPPTVTNPGPVTSFTLETLSGVRTYIPTAAVVNPAGGKG